MATGGGVLSQRFIGRSILVTHFDENQKQHSADGYLGNFCDPLKNKEIPFLFQLNTPGTQVWIPGYRADADEEGQTWEDRALNSAADSFFFALIHGRLGLLIGKQLVNKESLSPGGECWNRITSERTRNYIKVANLEPIASHYIVGMGDIELRIEVAGKDEKRERRALALVRDPGLMLTDVAQHLGLANPPIPLEWHPFTAVVTCEPREAKPDEEFRGDWVLQECEPPSHDRLSVDEIPATAQERRKEARKALRELSDWLYENIERLAAPSYSGVETDASELEDVGLVIEDPASGEALRLSPLKEVDRAPREDRVRRNKENDPDPPPEDDTEVDADEGLENPAPTEGGDGGSGPGTQTTTKQTRVTRTNRHEMEPIFTSVRDSSGNENSHQLRVSFKPPKVANGEDLQIEFRAVGEDESDYRMTIMAAKCLGENLQHEKNEFTVPANLLNKAKKLNEAKQLDAERSDEDRAEDRVEVELTLNEPLGVSTFRLLQIL